MLVLEGRVGTSIRGGHVAEVTRGTAHPPPTRTAQRGEARWPPPVPPPLWQPPSQTRRHASAGQTPHGQTPGGAAGMLRYASALRPGLPPALLRPRALRTPGRWAWTPRDYRPPPRLRLVVGRISLVGSAAAEIGARALRLPSPTTLSFRATTQRPLTASVSPPPFPPASLLIITSLHARLFLRASPPPLPPHPAAATPHPHTLLIPHDPLPHSLPPSPVKMNPAATCSGSPSTSW